MCKISLSVGKVRLETTSYKMNPEILNTFILTNSSLLSDKLEFVAIK